MRAVAFKCPATGKAVVLSPTVDDLSLPAEVTSVACCPHCGDQHTWHVRVGKPVSWLELLHHLPPDIMHAFPQFSPDRAPLTTERAFLSPEEGDWGMAM